MIAPAMRWPAGFVAAAGVVSAVVAAGGPSALRTVLVLAFLLLCPGLALLRLVGRFDVLATVTLALALSVAIDMALALGLAYTGLWSPAAALVALVAIVIGAAGADARRQGVTLR
jgi:uncharacterized membrane protein